MSARTHAQRPALSYLPGRSKSIGATGLTSHEIAAVIADLLTEEAASAHGADQARRDLLAIAADLLGGPDPLPEALRRWLADRMLALHQALDSGEPKLVTQALVGLGRRRRGRREKGSAQTDRPDEAWRDLEIAAAVAVLSDRAGGASGIHSIKESIAVAVGRSYNSVDRACIEHVIDLGGGELREDLREELRELAQGLAGPVLKALRLSLRRKRDVHRQEIRDLLSNHPSL